LRPHEVYRQIDKPEGVCYSVLVPNLKGLENALACGVKEIALFTAVSESFTQRNINCSIAESIQRFSEVVTVAKKHDLRIRGYVSCVLGCPYEGSIEPQKVASLTEQLIELGVDEISLGDTIGVGTPKQTQALIKAVSEHVPLEKLAMHFHDTYGQAIANIYASLELGINIFDSALAGLGGCPYAQGASGNVATEDVLYLMNGLGIETGVDIYKVIMAGQTLCERIGRENQSKVSRALT